MLKTRALSTMGAILVAAGVASGGPGAARSFAQDTIEPLSGGSGRGGGSNARVRRTFPLLPTAAGPAAGVRGKAEIEADRGREKVKAEVESSRLPAGTVVEVFFINPANSPDPVSLGTLTLVANPRNPRQVRGEI